MPTTDDQDQQQLAAALRQYGMQSLPADLGQLARYARLLWDWNQKLNLTRHTTWDQFVCRDLTDTWQLSQLLESGEEILDIGSGGGVPGVTLAILRPDLDLTLSESVGKKHAALLDMVKQLQLPVAVHHGRGEELLDDFRFDAVTARAVGPLVKLCRWLQPHWASIGRLLAVKGPNWTVERGEARHAGVLQQLQLRCAATYCSPGSEIQSVILKISR